MRLHRRHLDESQRAMVAARLASMEQGERMDLSPIGERSDAVSQPEAAELLKIGTSSLTRARTVLNHGDPELIAAVDAKE